jgi:endo-1,4-beta-xylanase
MKKILLAFMLLLAVTQQSNAATTVYNNGSGTYAGRLWKFWQTSSDNGYLIVWTNGYQMHYSNANDVTGGVGWSTGAERTISFNGLNISGGGHVLQSFYGWTKNPLVEYYIVENYGSVTPGSGTNMGTFSSDGGTYRIWKDTRVNAPSIIGTATFPQYKSVRTSRHSSGTITSRNHFNKWRSLGMNMGPIDSWTQLLHSEAMGGATGYAECGYVSNGGGSTTTTSGSTTTTSGGGGGYYLVRNRSTNGCVTNNSSSSNGADIRYTSCNSSYYSQQWQRNDRGSGYYTFINRGSGKAMRGTNGDVVQYTYYSNYWTEMWKREYGSSGYYHYRNRSTNTCMRAGGGDIYLSGCNSGYWSEMFILQ